MKHWKNSEHYNCIKCIETTNFLYTIVSIWVSLEVGEIDPKLAAEQFPFEPDNHTKTWQSLQLCFIQTLILIKIF